VGWRCPPSFGLRPLVCTPRERVCCHAVCLAYTTVQPAHKFLCATVSSASTAFVHRPSRQRRFNARSCFYQQSQSPTFCPHHSSRPRTAQPSHAVQVAARLTRRHAHRVHVDIQLAGTRLGQELVPAGDRVHGGKGGVGQGDEVCLGERALGGVVGGGLGALSGW